jgi:serine protease inhibitor
MRALASVLVLAGGAALGGCEMLTGPIAPRPEPLTSLPRALSVSEQKIIGASNRFAFELLRGVAAEESEPNVFLSPLSASMALGMTMNGARGETFEGMRSALGFPALDREELGATYRSLIDLLVGLDSSVEMRIANSIWLRAGFPLHDSFVRSSRSHFDARVSELDFADAGAPSVINRWVSEHTNGRIRDIVDEIDDDVMLYLINAIYFKGSWTSRFDPGRTQAADFHLADGTRQTVRMMHLPDAPVRMLWTPEAQLVDLPYGREAFSMTLVLPAEGRTVNDLVASLDEDRWNAWIAALSPGTVYLDIPRFRIEYEKILNETLEGMGMKVAFDPGRADFGEMSPLGEDLYVGNVKQKTFVEVNEEGTEAAAATSVEMRVVSMPPTFRADRPFLVAIRERLSGTILFLGVIGAPPSA